MNSHLFSLLRQGVFFLFLGAFIMSSNCSNRNVTHPNPSTNQIPNPIKPEEKIEKKVYYQKLTESYARPPFFLIANAYIWLLTKDAFVISNGKTLKKILYSRFKTDPCDAKNPKSSKNKNMNTLLVGVSSDGKSPCIPKPWIWGNLHINPKNRGLIHEKGIGVFGDKVIITMGAKQYYFTYDGTFLDMKKNERWWELKLSEYRQYPWKLNLKNAEINDVKFTGLQAKVFSGPWVFMMTGETYPMDVQLVDRRTGEIKHRFEKVKRTKHYFREYGNGFYIDKHKRPFMWYGEKTIYLETDKEEFCYVYKEKRKCVPDPGLKLKEVVETPKLRLFIDRDRIYVERFRKKSSP